MFNELLVFFWSTFKTLKTDWNQRSPPPLPLLTKKVNKSTVTFSICLWLSMFKMEMYYSLRDKNSSNVVVTMMMMTMMMMTMMMMTMMMTMMMMMMTMMMMTMMMMTYFIYAQLKYQINNRVKKFSID